MKKSELSTMTCSLANALAVIGDTWSLLIMKELMLGNRRFEGLQAQTGMSSNSLAQRLKLLEKHGIVRRTPYVKKPLRYEYKATAKGIDLWPVLVTLTGWGDKWANHGVPTLEYVHLRCEHSAAPLLSCAHCDDPVDAFAVRPVMSARMQADRRRRAPA